MRLYFVRHGESEANVAGLYSNRGWKHPLTDVGRDQVRHLAEQLKGRGVIAMYCSSLRRAVETAEILGSALGVPHKLEPALAEYDVGVFEDANYEVGQEPLADVERRWALGERDARPPGGESLDDIRARFVPCIGRIVARHHSDEGAVVLVGHGGTFWRGLPMVLANLDAAFMNAHHIPFAGLIEAEPAGGGLRCSSWCGEPLA